MGLQVLVWAICAGTMFYFEKEERFSWISPETMAAGRDSTLAKTAGNPYDQQYFSTNCSFRQGDELNLSIQIRYISSNNKGLGGVSGVRTLVFVCRGRD